MAIHEKQKEESTGGEKLSKEDIRKDVLEVMAEEREKTAATENLGSIRKQVDHLKGEMGKITQSLHCTADGQYCFKTPEELSDFMAKQAEEMKEIKGTLTEVVGKINNIKQPSATELPEGVKILEPMTEEKRKTWTEEQNRVRDDQVAANNRILNQTSNDGYRQMQEQDKDNIVNKADMRERFVKTLSPEEIKQAMVIGCKDGKCKVIRGELENTEGYKIYKKDEGGRFQPIDQEEKKPLIF